MFKSQDNPLWPLSSPSTFGKMIDLANLVGRQLHRAFNTRDIEVRIDLSEQDLLLTIPGLIKSALLLKTFKHISVELTNGSAVLLRLHKESGQ